MPTVLITGANRGLGFEFVRQYADDGWDVMACCRQPTKAEKLQVLAKDKTNIRIEALDVADFSATQKLANKAKDVLLDLLINNAGILTGDTRPHPSRGGDPTQDFGTIDPEAWDRLLRVNTIAP